MEIVNRLANISLEHLLSTSLEENLGLELEWRLLQKSLFGEDHELYYVEIVKNEASTESLQHLVDEWMPIYEQLCLHHDYTRLRMNIELKDGYNQITEHDSLMKAYFTGPEELWNDAENRIQNISQIDDAIFKAKDVPKDHLTYIANNAQTTAEVYTSIEQLMTWGTFSHSNTKQTEQKMKQSFQIIRQAIDQYNAKQEIEILYSLSEKREEFYIWLKGVLTAIRYKLYRELR